MSAVLVTGASGNVGSAVVMRLVRQGTPVRAALRAPGGLPLPAGAEPVAFDFGIPQTFAAALDGVDRVFLMRPPHISDAAALRPFIDAMAEAGVAHVVFLSVQGANRNPFVPHYGIEKLLRRRGLAWTFLRPSFFMQNLSTTHCSDIRDRGQIFVPAGNGRTNFVDADDVAEAAVACLTISDHGGRAYEITGTEALTYWEVAQILSEACCRPITYARPSAREFKSRMRAAGHATEFVAVMSSIYAMARLGMASGTTEDFERLVGHKPTTFAEWAARNAGCFAAEGV